MNQPEILFGSGDKINWYRVGIDGSLRVKVGKSTFLNILVIRKGNKFVVRKLVRGIYLSTCQNILDSNLVIPVRDVKKFVDDVLSNYDLEYGHTNQIGKEWIERWRKKKTTKV
jgi:hypothetical protein